MGKGDKKSKRGKIASKSYGVRRPRKNNRFVPAKPEIVVATEHAEEVIPKAKPKPKAPAKPKEAAKPKETPKAKEEKAEGKTKKKAEPKIEE
jgi:30S ribosomal protein S31